jgi:hypothetical protein
MHAAPSHLGQNAIGSAMGSNASPTHHAAHPATLSRGAVKLTLLCSKHTKNAQGVGLS